MVRVIKGEFDENGGMGWDRVFGKREWFWGLSVVGKLRLKRDYWIW